MEKKLYRSKTDKKIAGICGGLGKYLNIDVTLIRVVWAVVSMCGGAGLLAYIICAFVIPEEPDYIEG